MTMPAVPKVIFLYDNDALEVRYSDESRLELSPCGAAMVFHPPVKPGEHSRHRLSQHLHKRTQFVTSEHRLKVLQALDFRNRFAKRPYLCKELLQAYDIVSLYAAIDHVKWPKSQGQAEIAILPDGSRKITSLDDYASLIVSPHGQDFSVCYLSKLSSEQQQSSHNIAQPLTSPSLPYQLSSSRGRKKTSEAVISPYFHEQSEFTADGNLQTSAAKRFSPDHVDDLNVGQEFQKEGSVAEKDADFKRQPEVELQTHGQGGGVFSQKQLCQPQVASSVVQPNVQSNVQPFASVQSHVHPPSPDQSTSQLPSQVQPIVLASPAQVPPVSQMSSYSNVQSTLQHDTQGQPNSQQSTQLQQNSPLVPQIQPHPKPSSHLVQTSSHSSRNLDCDFKHGQENAKPGVADVWYSPVPHEISSISRSSTPDGLRMTIDSDTTLTHDSSYSEAVRYRQRHSSPTHQFPSDDDVQMPFAQLVELKSSSVQGSFISIPWSNQKDCWVSADGHDNTSSKSLTPTKQTTVRAVNTFDEPTLRDKQGEVGKEQLPLSTSSPPTSHSAHHHCQENLDLTPQNLHGGKDSGIQNSSEDPGHWQPTTSLPESHQADGVFSTVKGANPNSEIQRHFFVDSESATCSMPFNPVEEPDLTTANQRTVDFLPPGHLQSPNFTVPQNAAADHFQTPTQPSDCASLRAKQLAFEKGAKNNKGSTLTGHFHEGEPLHNEEVENENERKSSSKVKYVWTTCHGSRNSCPKEWTHPLMLAIQGRSVPSQGDDASPPRTKDKVKDSYVTSLPSPLPLTCPFQHTHKSEPPPPQSPDDEEDWDRSQAMSNIGVFQKGRLKVVLSEGIIYRLIPASGMTVVEIYPGDGSVLISQGAKAFFFNHFIPRDGQLEERMYSLKSLPPRCSKAFRPIEKMLKTANRFLHVCLSWDKRCGKRIPPCWQKEMVAVVEPLSSSILEECVIDGLGKFSAYSNGRVRIVFDDRTSLYMMSDFSSRFGSSAKMSMSHGAVEGDVAQLLLPSGNNVLVEKQSSGPYNRYLKVAREWVAWVNTSPADRHKFYAKRNEPVVLEQAAQLELKKINCFNYILENTFQPIQQSSLSQISLSPRTCSTLSSSSSPKSAQSPQGQSHSQRSRTDAPSISSMPQRNHLNYSAVPDRQPRAMADTSSIDTAMGFLSVKQALAQTSSLISDIEHFLEENKS